MSGLFNKEVNTQKENLKNTSGVHASSRKPTKKCVMKMKETKKKQCMHKNVFDGRKHFIGHIQKRQKQFGQLHVSDSRHNGGTICLVNG